jgi:resolvase-like protein
MRAAIYARFSTDLQSAASIDDQVRVCRERIEQEGHQVVEVYADRAISGANRVPGIQSLMAVPRRASLISSTPRPWTASVATRRTLPVSTNGCALRTSA